MQSKDFTNHLKPTIEEGLYRETKHLLLSAKNMQKHASDLSVDEQYFCASSFIFDLLALAPHGNHK